MTNSNAGPAGEGSNTAVAALRAGLIMSHPKGVSGLSGLHKKGILTVFTVHKKGRGYARPFKRIKPIQPACYLGTVRSLGLD